MKFCSPLAEFPIQIVVRKVIDGRMYWKRTIIQEQESEYTPDLLETDSVALVYVKSNRDTLLQTQSAAFIPSPLHVCTPRTEYVVYEE